MFNLFSMSSVSWSVLMLSLVAVKLFFNGVDLLKFVFAKTSFGRNLPFIKVYLLSHTNLSVVNCSLCLCLCLCLCVWCGCS